MPIATAMSLTAACTFGHEGKHDKKSTDVKKVQETRRIAGDAKDVKRTVEPAKSDAMGVTQDKIEVDKGEAKEIVQKNKGKTRHEAVSHIGREVPVTVTKPSGGAHGGH